MATTHHLSQAAHDRLAAELEELTTHGRIDIARKIEEARMMGDLSENGDYHAAKEEQGKMEARIGHLQALLEQAEIIPDEAGDTDVVRVGSIVTVAYDADDEESYFLGSIEERDTEVEVMSPTSPLGQALLAVPDGEATRPAREGDDVSYEVNGRDVTVTVTEIRPGR
jgi:transcription elongation factor GreA